jgi:hypothetical protein
MLLPSSYDHERRNRGASRPSQHRNNAVAFGMEAPCRFGRCPRRSWVRFRFAPFSSRCAGRSLWFGFAGHGNSREVNATPSAAPPRPRTGKSPAGQVPGRPAITPSHHSNAPISLKSQSIRSKKIARFISTIAALPMRRAMARELAYLSDRRNA